jgi:preprotein translocase subunit SecE
VQHRNRFAVGKVIVADKDEVEPTDESTPAEPTSVTGDPSELSASTSDDVEPGEAELPAEDVTADELDAGELSDDEFDEILRHSGVSDEEAPDGDLDGPDGDVSNGDKSKVLEPAVVGAAAAGATAKKARTTRSPKETPTNKRDQIEKRERTTPAKFVRQSVGELRKVVYPTGQQLINYFVVVLVFVLFIIAYVSLLDLGLGAAIFKVFS